MRQRQPALAAVVLMAATLSASAQGLPAEPVSLAGGRVVLGAEVSGTLASTDPGFFNYTADEYHALRNLRVGVTARVEANRWLDVLAEVRADRGVRLRPFALYARIRPWAGRRFDIRAGRVPPTFGLSSRSGYGSANLLIGVPLAYQYLTSLRPDALPATTQDLLRMRGRGWLATFPLGSAVPHAGLPIVNLSRWDTGVQIQGAHGRVEWTGALTAGSLSNPRVGDDNGGRGAAARVIMRPTASLAVGASGARAQFLDRALEPSLPVGRRLDEGVQQAVALDAEYSSGRFLARGEAVRSTWTLPIGLSGPANERLHATAVMVESRYRLWPGVQAAGRLERLDFSRLPTATGLQTWDAPVRRVELGGSYAIVRHVLVKASWQRSTRSGGRVRRDNLGALQVIYWF